MIDLKQERSYRRILQMMDFCYGVQRTTKELAEHVNFTDTYVIEIFINLLMPKYVKCTKIVVGKHTANLFECFDKGYTIDEYLNRKEIKRLAQEARAIAKGDAVRVDDDESITIKYKKREPELQALYVNKYDQLFGKAEHIAEPSRALTFTFDPDATETLRGVTKLVYGDKFKQQSAMFRAQRKSPKVFAGAGASMWESA